ncbi:hypothetical protein [Streptomyces sp. NPDC059080]
MDGHSAYSVEANPGVEVFLDQLRSEVTVLTAGAALSALSGG